MDVRETHQMINGVKTTRRHQQNDATIGTRLLLQMNLHNCLIIILEERIEFDCMRRCLLMISSCGLLMPHTRRLGSEDGVRGGEESESQEAILIPTSNFYVSLENSIPKNEVSLIDHGSR